VSGLAIAGLVIPLLVGVGLFFPPDEWILGALDPGSYINAGAAIAQTGHIVAVSPILATMDPAVRTAFFPFPASRLPGFYLTTGQFHGVLPVGFVVSPDQVVPHGFHLYPTVLAFGYALGGVQVELLVTPLLALLGLAAFFLLARRLFGIGVATVATLLLAISPAEVWFARYPDAEILSQVLTFGGLLAFVAMVDTRSRWLGVASGLALGANHLTKIETLPIPFLLALFFGYQAVTRRFDRRWTWFLVPYVALLVQAIIHATYISTWYAATSFQKTLPPRELLGLGGAFLTVLLFGIALTSIAPFRASLSRLVQAQTLENPISIGLPLVVGVLGAYAYYVRPQNSEPVPAAAMTLFQLQTMNDLQSFVRLGWYVTPLGVLLGTIGWMLIASRERSRRTILPLLVLATETVLFLDHMDITPIHYWAARRWVTLVIPGVCLAVAYLLVHLAPRVRHRWLEAALPVGCGLALTLGLLGETRPLIGYVEYRGAIQQLGTLAATFPANSVVLFPDGDSGARFSTPLEYLFDRRSFLILDDPGVHLAAANAARRWLAQGVSVFWVATADRPDPVKLGLKGNVISHQRISLPEKIATLDHAPGADGLFQQDLIIWQLDH
jgi:hypothetical protein